jgi:hypothetical protein
MYMYIYIYILYMYIVMTIISWPWPTCRHPGADHMLEFNDDSLIIDNVWVLGPLWKALGQLGLVAASQKYFQTGSSGDGRKHGGEFSEIRHMVWSNYRWIWYGFRWVLVTNWGVFSWRSLQGYAGIIRPSNLTEVWVWHADHDDCSNFVMVVWQRGAGSKIGTNKGWEEKMHKNVGSLAKKWSTESGDINKPA